MGGQNNSSSTCLPNLFNINPDDSRTKHVWKRLTWSKMPPPRTSLPATETPSKAERERALDVGVVIHNPVFVSTSTESGENRFYNTLTEAPYDDFCLYDPRI